MVSAEKKNNNKILVIVGQTATGKTDLGLHIAKLLNGEIISCDSRQVYKGLDLGTGKLPGKEVLVNKGDGFWEMDGVNVWMLDVALANEQYDVKQFITQAQKILFNLQNNSKLPILVGGTGLYVKALLEGIDNLNQTVDYTLREKLEQLSLTEVQQELQKISLDRWNTLNNSEQHNKRRLIRHIELLNKKSANSKPDFTLRLKDENNILKIGLTAENEVINQKIDRRLDNRIEQGLIEEGERLLQDGISLRRMDELGLEYRYIAKLLSGEIDKVEFTQLLKTKIHQFAKRQRTWFKKDTDVHWFDCTDLNLLSKVEKLVLSWYNQGA